MRSVAMPNWGRMRARPRGASFPRRPKNRRTPTRDGGQETGCHRAGIGGGILEAMMGRAAARNMPLLAPFFAARNAPHLIPPPPHPPTPTPIDRRHGHADFPRPNPGRGREGRGGEGRGGPHHEPRHEDPAELGVVRHLVVGHLAHHPLDLGLRHRAPLAVLLLGAALAVGPAGLAPVHVVKLQRHALHVPHRFATENHKAPWRHRAVCP